MTYDLEFFQNFEQTGGRQVLFVAQTGSVNYNLETPQSDKDFQVFLLPTFEDLYSRNLMASEYRSPELDVKFNDVRHLEHQLHKSNPNFLDMLFSRNLVYVHPDLQFLVDERERLAASNLSRLFYSCKGLFHDAEKRFLSSKDPLDGDFKQVSHALRMTYLMRMFRVNLRSHKKDAYADALFLESGSRYHHMLMDYKNRVAFKNESWGHERKPFDDLSDEQKKEYLAYMKHHLEYRKQQFLRAEKFYKEMPMDKVYLEEMQSRVKNRLKFMMQNH